MISKPKFKKLRGIYRRRAALQYIKSQAVSHETIRCVADAIKERREARIRTAAMAFDQDHFDVIQRRYVWRFNKTSGSMGNF